MARIDDYQNARKLAVERLLCESAENIRQRSGFKRVDGDILVIPFLDKIYHVVVPEMIFRQVAPPGNAEAPVQEQVLILHYILGSVSETASVAGRWVSYREIPGASFYYSAFVKRAINPLKNTFGHNVPGFKKASDQLGGKPLQLGDAGFEFELFPRVFVQLVLWEGDAEFPAEAGILFDAAIGSMLSPEDIAWLSGMLVYRLMALSRSL